MTEQQPFELLAKHGDIEIRRYPAYVLVQAKSRGEFMRAGNRAFNPLLSYISGSNAGRQQIAMTAPVSQSRAAGGLWRVSFVMPKKYTLQTLPVPDGKSRASWMPDLVVPRRWRSRRCLVGRMTSRA